MAGQEAAIERVVPVIAHQEQVTLRHFKQDSIVPPVTLFLAMGQPGRTVRRGLAPLICRDAAAFGVRLVAKRPNELAVDGCAVADHLFPDHLDGIARQAHDPLDHHPACMRVLEDNHITEFGVTRKNAPLRYGQVTSKAERQGIPVITIGKFRHGHPVAHFQRRHHALGWNDTLLVKQAREDHEDRDEDGQRHAPFLQLTLHLFGEGQVFILVLVGLVAISCHRGLT